MNVFVSYFDNVRFSCYRVSTVYLHYEAVIEIHYYNGTKFAVVVEFELNVLASRVVRNRLCLTEAYAMHCAKRIAVTLFQIRLKSVSADWPKTWMNTSSLRKLHTSCATREFHEYDKRSGYDTGFEIADTRIERIRLAFKQLKKEIKLWKNEWKETFEADPILDYRAGIFIYYVVSKSFFFILILLNA